MTRKDNRPQDDELRRLAETYNQPELKTEMEQKIQEFSGALGIGM